MRRSKALDPQITLLLLILPGVAHAQVFTVPANPFSPAAASASARQERVQAGLYLALWEFSSIQVGGLSEELKADPSPLVTLDYFVTPKFSVGGWWNPFGGEVRAGSRGGPKRKIGDTDSSFWDIHGAYRLTRRPTNNWSVQVGFSHLRHNISYIPAVTVFGFRNFATDSSSFNLWINNSQQVGVRRVQNERQPISLFSSIGYYTSLQFQHAANIMVGGTLPLSKQLSLSSSAWLNDFDHVNTRVTVGIAGEF